MAVLVGASQASAATLTAGNDYPSTLQSSQAANHAVIFTTPSGVAENETITLSFSSSFDTSSLTEDDIDIEDDGLDLTTATDCTGSEMASVSVSSDVVTVTLCAGDGGAIAATSVVTIELGTNATASGTGVNQITNPTSSQTAFVTIAGTFGDRGTIALPIGGDDSIAVTASVPAAGGGGGGGSSSSTDSTFPVITSVSVSSITASTATVSWITDELSDSFVNIGFDSTVSLDNFSDNTLVTSHSIALSGLLDGQTYYFNVNSSDSSGNQSASATSTFTMLDQTPPVISDIEVIEISYDSASITWLTDSTATTIVSYGLTDAYTDSATISGYAVSHSVELSGLDDLTEYHFQVISADSSFNQSYSADQTFTTQENLPPANVSSFAIEADVEELHLTWTNPTDGDLGGVKIVQCANDFPDSPTDEDCESIFVGLEELVDVTGLTGGVVYYFGAFSFDEAGQFASGSLGSGLPSVLEEEVPSEEEESSEDETSEAESESESTPEGDSGSGSPTEGSSGGSLPSDSSESGSSSDDTSTGSSAGSAVFCGDGECSGSETSLSCSMDCPISQPTSLGAESGVLSDDAINIFAGQRSIELQATSSGVVEVLPTSIISVQIPVAELEGEVLSARLTMGSELFILSLDETNALYIADVTVPSVQGIHQAVVSVEYTDGSVESTSSYLRVVTPGHVLQVIDGEEVSVANATITLFEVISGDLITWDGSPYGQYNPVTTEADGSFYWYVPNGTYAVEVSAEGFGTTSTGQFVVVNALINPDIRMSAIGFGKDRAEVSFKDSADSPKEPSPVKEGSAAKVLEAIVNLQPVEAVQESIAILREIPGAQEAAEISTPTLAVTAGVSVVVLSVAFDFLPFLQYLFTAPILFFWRKRRKGYGVVYNAISKTPVDLAMVRLFKVSEEDEAAGGPGRLVKSRVTDKGGRYFFLAEPGRYRILVTKVSYQFPSEYMAGEQADGQYLDVYHAEPIVVTEANAVISANIPLDPLQQDVLQASSTFRRQKLMRSVQTAIALAGVLAAALFAIIRPTPFSIGMIAIQVGVYLLAKRLAQPHKPISWGVVYDKFTGRPVSRVVARIFEPKYNKVLETQVTDSKGRYSFMLGPNKYYATFQKEGFKNMEIRPIDFSSLDEPIDFSQEVALEPDIQLPAQDVSPPV